MSELIGQVNGVMTHHKCGMEVKLEYNCFFWQGVYFSGWVCEKCNALFENKEDSMFEYIKINVDKDE